MYKLHSFWQHHSFLVTWIRRLIIVGLILAVITLVSPFSPLQSVFGLGDDFGVYATYADFIGHGELPLRDFFDMKGPVWMYWWGLIGAFYPGDVFRGMFLCQCLAGIINYCLISRILRRHQLGRYHQPLSIVATLALYLAIPPQPIAPSLGSIGSWLLTAILACILLFQNWRQFTHKQKFWWSVALGVATGLVFWSKYLDMGIFLVTLLWITWQERHRKIDWCWLWGGFFAGALTVSLSVILWYTYHGAIGDLFYHYFSLPLHAYGNQTATSLPAKILKVLEQIYLMWNLPANQIWSLCWLVVVSMFLTLKRPTTTTKLFWLTLLTGGIIFNGLLGHFYDWFWVMGIFVLMLACVLSEKLLTLSYLPPVINYCLLALLIVVMLGSRNYQTTSHFIYGEKQDLMSSIISFSPQPKLLALYPYSWYTFFHGTNAINAGRYYLVPTLSRAGAPQVFEEIITMIAQRIPDLVVTRFGSSELQHEHAPAYEYNTFVIDGKGYFFPQVLINNYQIRLHGQEFILWEQKPASAEATIASQEAQVLQID